MLSYQDYINAIGDNDEKKKAFIQLAIQEYQNSELYKRAEIAQLYYERKNVAILQRLNYLQKTGLVNESKVIFHKLCNGFFSKMCKQLSQYLLGNGVTVDDEYKKKLGSRFDKDLQTMGINTLVDGVNWGFWNVDRLKHYRATEFFALFDEWTGQPMVGIHFWNVVKEDKKKRVVNIEVFELAGITSYTMIDGKMQNMQGREFIPYKTKVYSDQLTTQIIGFESYQILPVFPLYANELQQSEFNDGLKSVVDAYDFISSDLADGITQIEGIYWAIKNYGGSDAAELIKEIENYRATVNQDGAEVQNFDVEIPFKAKEYALKLLEDSMYSESMILNIRSIQGGSLTNVGINVAKTDFDLKADIFEWQVSDFVQNILKLLGAPDVEIKFKRRTITNDTETVNNISTMMTDGYIDEEWAINNNPLIVDSDQIDLLSRILTNKMGVPEFDQILDEEEIFDQGIEEEEDLT